MSLHALSIRLLYEWMGRIDYRLAYSPIVISSKPWTPACSRKEPVKKTTNKFLGKWRLLEMEQWDKDFIDLVGEGHITFEKKDRGQLQFGAVECDRTVGSKRSGIRNE